MQTNTIKCERILANANVDGSINVDSRFGCCFSKNTATSCNLTKIWETKVYKLTLQIALEIGKRWSRLAQIAQVRSDGSRAQVTRGLDTL